MIPHGFFRKSLGWRNWSVFTYNSFIEHIFVVFYIAVFERDYSNGFILQIFLFYGFSIFSTSFGYLVNDLGDRELDAFHQKSNTFQDVTQTHAIGITLFVFLGSVVFALPFISKPYFIILWLLWIFAAMGYSLKPLRLKEKGKSGLIVVVLAQRLLPILLVFSAFRFSELFDILIISGYIFLRGFASDVYHQLSDYEADSATGTATFAVEKGLESTRRFFHAILEFEKLLLLVFLIRLSMVLSYEYDVEFHWMWLVFLGVLLLYFINLYLIGKGRDRNPFHPNQRNVFQFIHHPFPTIILPILLIAILITHNRLYLLFLALILIQKRMWDKEIITSSFPFQVFRKSLKALKRR